VITSGRAERAYPFVLGVTFSFAVALTVYKLNFSASDSVKDLFASAINVGAIVIGFLDTMQSILLTLEKRRLVTYLKEANKFNRLVDYLMGAIVICIVAAVCSGVVLFLEGHKEALWYKYLLAVWVGLTVSAISSCYRAFSIMSAILKD
jgi:hypothetical protein